MHEPCLSDSDCALFADECRRPLPILKAAVPTDAHTFQLEDKTVIQTFNMDKKKCDQHLLVHPLWPVHPVAKCVKNKCVIVESIPPKADI